MRRRERWAERVVERDRDMRGKRRKEGKKKERGRYQQLGGWRRKRSWGRGGNGRRCSVRECGEAG